MTTYPSLDFHLFLLRCVPATCFRHELQPDSRHGSFISLAPPHSQGWRLNQPLLLYQLGLVHSSLGKPNTTAEVFYVVSFQGMFHHFCICWLYRSILIQRGRQLHKAMKTTRWGSLVTTLEAGHQGFQVFRICTWTVAQISARIRYTYAEARVKTQCCHCPQPLWV